MPRADGVARRCPLKRNFDREKLERRSTRRSRAEQRVVGGRNATYTHAGLGDTLAEVDTSPTMATSAMLVS